MYVMTLTNRLRSALVGEAAARLGGDVSAVDLDAGGRQEEHAGRDPLDGPVEAEDQPGGEVHHAAGVGLVHIGEIHNDGDAVAEGLADDAGLVVGGGVDRDDAAQVGNCIKMTNRDLRAYFQGV